MAKKNTFQTVVLKPLTGIMDMRSNLDEMPIGAFRFKQNYAVNPDGKLSRCLGWSRPYQTICAYKNWDWHDQGVAAASREPVTMMLQSVENDGTRRLFIATKTRILRLEEAPGSYSQIGSGYGVDGLSSKTQVRFHAAELQNIVYFTNDFDIPQYHDLSTNTVQAIPGLVGAGEDGSGDITKARVILSWSGLLFLLNTEENGTRYSSRIRWSDLNDGQAWDISDAASVSDYQDLTYGEVILNAVPLAGAMYVFTDKSIWRCTPSIDPDPDTPTMVLHCDQVYTEPKNRAKCLSYPNALISTGFEIYYMASDGIYRYDPYLPQPERTEWIHRATGVIYKDFWPDLTNTYAFGSSKIDKQACESPIMEYVPGPNDDETAGSGEVHVSWPNYDPIAVAVDPSEAGGIDCATYVPTPNPTGSGLNKHTLVLNLKNSTCDYRDYGSSAMVNFTSSLLAGECAQQSTLLAANGADLTIKSMNSGYSRESYDAEADQYTTDGYYSVLRFLFPFERFPEDKIIAGFAIDLESVLANDEAVMGLRMAVADRALDPNQVNGNCGVLWHVFKDVPIRCSYTKSPEAYVNSNIRPNLLPVSWAYYLRGKFLHVELTLKAADGSKPTSGGHSMSRFEVDVKTTA